MILSCLRPGAVIRIGSHVVMAGVSMNCRAAITIGKHVQIGPGVCIWDNDGQALDPDERRFRQTVNTRAAPIVIEEDAFVGARAIVLKGVTIGKGAVIGAGAVVTKSVEAFEVVAGNPARVIGNALGNSRHESAQHSCQEPSEDTGQTESYRDE